MLKKQFFRIFILLLIFSNQIHAFQKIKIKTNSENSQVYVDDKLAGKGNDVELNFEKSNAVKQIKLENSGFKNSYKVYYTGKKPERQLQNSIKSTIKDNEFYFNRFDVKTPFKTDSTKFILLKDVELMVNEVLDYTSINYNELKNKNFKPNTSDVYKVTSADFVKMVAEVLETLNYNKEKEAKNYGNSLFLNAKIVSINLKKYEDICLDTKVNFFETTLEVEWQLLNFDKQVKFSKKVLSTSGEFIDKNGAQLSIKDALILSFYRLLEDESLESLLKIEEIEVSNFDVIQVKKKNYVASLEDALNASFTIKTNDGHCSGFAISEDGYIVTNFQAVEKAKSIKVIDKNGKEFSAELIRKNKQLDLALLKVSAVSFESVFQLPSQKQYAIGEEIFVVGCPEYIELGQTISKGIISGYRKIDNQNLIQMDASVNEGSSGGPLISKSGQLFGVVNSKIKKIGVEGIGFVIPAELIKETLGLSE